VVPTVSTTTGDGGVRRGGAEIGDGQQLKFQPRKRKRDRP
jgi:hypothetical protein